MSKRQAISGPQFRGDRPMEQEAVRTTIVGGRPPGSGLGIGEIPRGIEVLVKKASVDPAFRALLLQERAAAAGQIGLVLDPAEVMMLRAVPAAQLGAIIARTNVPQEHRRAFLGKAAAAMLAAIGVITEGCSHHEEVKGIRPKPAPGPAPTGSRPDVPGPPEPVPSGKEPAGSQLERPGRAEPSHGDRPPPEPSEPPTAEEPPAPTPSEKKPEPEPIIRGIRPDPVTKGIRPDPVPRRPEPPPAPTGIRPD